ncbi:MAG: hypothetical protein PHV24_02960 [Candidatus Kapabacteria bacterium]|nr:hypothetical protein [Candidatus Kapabacteria bacterium]
MKYFLNIVLMILVLGIAGCIEENENLVNPPSQKGTVKIRFLNLASDFETRAANIDGEDYLNSAYGQLSESLNPPSDSIVVVVKKGSEQEFKYPQKIKFVRSTYTTMLALPTPFGAENARAVDTLIYWASSSGLPTGTPYSYIKFVNAYPDTTCTFSAIDGCPNGTPYYSAQRYRSVSSQTQVRAGSNPISIIKNSSAGNEKIGLFDFVLQNDMQYTIIVSAGADGAPVVDLIDEFTDESTAMARSPQIYENNAFIRTLNFSSQEVNIKKSDEIITSAIAANKVGAFDIVSACGSQYADSLSPEYSGFKPTTNTVSLNVNEKYSYIIADSATKRAGLGLIIPEAVVDYMHDDRALIRVVNLDNEVGEIYLTTGGRTDTSAKGFTGGETIGNKIEFGEVGGIYPLYIGSGKKRVPLTLFTASLPTRLIATAFAEFEAGRSYLAVIKRNSAGVSEMYVVDDETTSSELTPLGRKQFYQFVNFATGKSSGTLSYLDVLENIKVGYSQSMASVSEMGETSLTFEGASCVFTPREDRASLIIAAGTTDMPQFITLNSKIPTGPMAYSVRRFVNAASDVPTLTVHLDSKDGLENATDVEYLSVSGYAEDTKQRSYSMFFVNSQTGELVYRLDEIQVINGKIYTFVLGGNAKDGYSVNIVQEY